MSNVVLGLAVAVTIAASASSFCCRPPALAPNSEAVAATVRILPVDILQSQISALLSR